MKTIKLQLYRGKELSYDKHSKVKNENQAIKITDGGEWFNYLKYIKAQGLCQVDLISVIEDGKRVEDISLWVNQLKEACLPEIEVVVIESNFVQVDKLSNDDKNNQDDSKTSGVEDKKAIREALKKKADELKLTYPKTISNDKLKALIEKAK